MSILDIKMDDNDAGASTIRSYLKALLRNIWEEKESFSGKRPFGNSGWEYDLYTALVSEGAVKGVIEDGELGKFDQKEADQLIRMAFDSLQ